MKIFNSVSDLALASLTADQLCEVKEVGRYRIKASGSGIGLANGRVAVPVASGTSVNVLQFGADPTGVADSASAIDGYDTIGTIVIPEGTYKISTSFSITSDVVFMKGASLSIDSGIALTINGTVMAPDTQEIFSGDGSVVLAQTNASIHWFDTINKCVAALSANSTIFIHKDVSFAGATINKKLNFWGFGREYINVTGSHTLSGTGGNSTFNNLTFKTPSTGTVLITVSGVGGGNYRDCRLLGGTGNYIFDWDRDGTTPQIFELMQTKVESGKLCKTTSSGAARTFFFHVKESSLFTFSEANMLDPDNAAGDYISLSIYNSLININDPQICSNSKCVLEIVAGSTIDDNTTDAAWRDNNGTGFDTLNISSNVTHTFNSVGRFISTAPYYDGTGVSSTQTNWQTVPSGILLTFDADLFDEVFYEGTATPLTATQSWVMKAGAGKFKGQRFKLYIVGSIDTQGNTVNMFGRALTPTSQELQGLIVEGVFDGTSWAYSYSDLV